MGSWGYPQWIMLAVILFEFVGGCLRMAQSEAKQVEDVKWRKQHAEALLFTHTLLNLFEVWLLAKSGFW